MKPAARDANRNKFPTIAAVMDDVRKFFPNARVLYASENGHEAGDRALHEEIEREFGRTP